MRETHLTINTIFGGPTKLLGAFLRLCNCFKLEGVELRGYKIKCRLHTTDEDVRERRTFARDQMSVYPLERLRSVNVSINISVAGTLIVRAYERCRRCLKFQQSRQNDKVIVITFFPPRITHDGMKHSSLFIGNPPHEAILCNGLRNAMCAV